MKRKDPIRFVTLSVIRREDLKPGDIVFVKAKRSEVDINACCESLEMILGKEAKLKIIAVPYEIDLEFKHVRVESEPETTQQE